MDYYEQYLKVSNKDFSVLQNYLNALKDNSTQESINKKYVDYYTSYFDDIIKKDSNIIEDLDEAFTKRPTGSYDTWESFKSSFSNLANDVAWHVVEKGADKTTIQKAIVWSETSLKISKNVHYYLDTLAQLYYKNGEKTKAISTEEKALELGKDSEYGEEYKITLEKMKNGSY
jgi:tetratricopeptide (TPR) repeat protein